MNVSLSMFLQRKKEELKKRYKYLIIAASLAVIFSGTGVVFAMRDSGAASNQDTSQVSVEKRKYRTTSPKKVKDDQVLLIGKVLSHESASVYPRRAGIVEDILVDIGDPVQKGQILAYLLPEGVESQSGLEIQAMKDQMQKAYDEYQNTKALSYAEIEKLEKKLEEKRVALKRLKEDNYKDGGDLRLKHETLQLERDQLAILERQLNEAVQLEKVLVKDAEEKVQQSMEGLLVTLYDVHLVSMRVLGGGSKLTYSLSSDVSKNRVEISSWVHSQERLNAFVNHLNSYRSVLNQVQSSDGITQEKSTLLVAQAESLLIDLQHIVNGMIGLPSSSSATLDSLAAAVQNAQAKFYAAKEKHEKAVNALTETQVRQREKVELLQEKVIKQKTTIALSTQKWEKSGTEVASKIDILEAGIAQFEKEIEYARARIQRSIDASKNQHNIANTNYKKTIAQKGHTAIKAPFSGVIAKRSISVGEVAMMGMPVFGMVDVKTSLSSKAKNEIQFGLPEDLKGVLSVGDSLAFFLPDNELDVYHAEVTRISPQIDDELHTITVQAKLSDDLSFPHHTSVQVRVVTGEKETYQVESSALKREDEKNYVWIQFGESEPEKLYVSVLEEDGEFAHVSGDLNEETSILMNYYGKR